MRKWVVLLCLLFLCGCGKGSMTHDNLDMEQALIDMAVEMREKGIGSIMDEQNQGTEKIKQNFELSLTEEDYAYLCSIRQDVWQEAVIFHCNDENWSIIKESAQLRMQAALQQGIPASLGTCGDYLYLLIGNQAQWMRTYMEGLS